MMSNKSILTVLLLCLAVYSNGCDNNTSANDTDNGDQTNINTDGKTNDNEHPHSTLTCQANQHLYNNACEPDSMQNCGAHGKSCKPAQTCTNGSCQDRPCTYESKNSRSPAICVDNHMLVCGSDNIYYFDSKNGNCTQAAPCTVCPDGFAGCAADSDVFCQNHQILPLPTTCIYGVHPAVCYNNVGYMCGSNGAYYSSVTTRCSGTDSCVLCQNGYLGCSSDAKAFCSGQSSFPLSDSSTCTTGHRRCDGKKLMECDGTSYSIVAEECESYCTDGSDGSSSACSETKPSCTIKDGIKARVVGWNDGDTVVVVPVSEDSSCSSTNDLGREVHFSIRVLHIDSPECSKSQNYTYSNVQTCNGSTSYSETNDPYGYEAWEKSTALADSDAIVTLNCENADEYNVCPNDVNGRPLTYVKTSSEEDISTELVKAGLAFPSINRMPNPTEHEKQICRAFKDAVQNHRKLWSHCTTTDGQCIRDTAAQLLSTRPGEYDYTYEYCQLILGEEIQTGKACSPSTTFCEEGKLYQCSKNGLPSLSKTCSNGCDSTHTACENEACTPGETVCTAQTMSYCNERGELEFLKSCTCNSEGTQCSDCSGVEFCFNDEYHYCSYSSMISVHCPDGCNGRVCSCRFNSDCPSEQSPICDGSTCKSPDIIPCTKYVSPGQCGGDGHAYFCDNSGYYYLGRRCTDTAPCVVCPDGYGGCTSDSDTFCQDHML